MTAMRLAGCVALGQLLSLLIAATGVFSQFLGDRGVHIPTTQSFLNYLLLAAVYSAVRTAAWLRRGRDGEHPFGVFQRRDGWSFLFIALADVEGNFFGWTAFVSFSSFSFVIHSSGEGISIYQHHEV